MMVWHRFPCMRFVRLAVSVGLSCACPAFFAADGPKRTRNAVFNGDFTEGVTGWSKLGPGHTTAMLTTEKSQYAHILTTDLIVTSPRMERTFSVYSPHLLQVKPGSEYRMRIQASGSGHFRFGAFEYEQDGHHIGNNYSERHVLSNTLKEYSFVYSPTTNATGIRPSIVFLEATDGARMDVRARIRTVEIPVPDDEFGEMCENWPEYAKDTRFADYTGFSEAERAELEAIADVDAVLPPYEPIRMNAPGDFSLTTSRLRFGKHILPQQVSILGEEVLAEPIELSVKLDDGTTFGLPPPEPAIRSTGHRAFLRQELHDAGRTMAVALDLAYDAFLVYTVTFPETPGASIANVTLSIPFLPSVGKYIRYNKMAVPTAGGYGDWVFGYGAIPERGQRVETRAFIGSAHMSEANRNDWTPLVPDSAGLVWEWKRGFLRTVWIGDEARGISLVSLSTQGYRAEKGDCTTRLIRSDRAVRLTYNFVTHSVPLNQKRVLQFVLQIMPPKPVRTEWSASRFSPFFSGYPTVSDPCLAVLEKRPADNTPEGETTVEAPAYGKDYDVVRKGVLPGRWVPTVHRPYRDIGFYWFTLWSQGSRGWAPGVPVGGCSNPLVGYPERLSKLIRCSERLGHLGLPYLAATHIAAENPAGHYYVEKTDEWTHHPRVPRPPYLRPTCPNSLFSAYMAGGSARSSMTTTSRGSISTTARRCSARTPSMDAAMWMKAARSGRPFRCWASGSSS
ncbi:MAG: hypothetical protein HN742_11795 [Lentisphaerae bacterium]|jgi:hypothetical protein|nr:hypothetical protein [Lentisphaerota bacterium]MBT5605726.1 hypothetical protein [Lentisphaerota bacterium]MBT7061956.1 hypothetical protein [Lentisphaerota bacterium]MBT7842551.1 hypothetical protein [Lentisphaerota bacterium]